MASFPGTLNAVSYLAPNMFWYYAAVIEAVASALDADATFTQSRFDPLDDPALHGDVDLAFICGLPLVRFARLWPGEVELLASPVMAGARYHRLPTYFTDVIVRADAPYRRLSDLDGATYCYNDPGSNSGFHLPRYHLMQAGYHSRFFGGSVRSGSHQRSIQHVVAGDADCAAIDSLVLEQALRDDPALARRLRVVEAIGPCPIPPVIVTSKHGPAFVERARAVLLNPPAALRAAMQKANVSGYRATSPDDYAVVGSMFDAVNRADYQLT